jgi:SAM-dependent methyltransferase
VAEALDGEDASVDTVLMLDVYEHIRPERRAAALSEVARVLAPGGELCLVTPSRARLRLWNVFDNLLSAPGRLRRGERARLWSFAGKGHPEHFVSRRELLRDLAAAGLDAVHFERVGFYPAPERPGFAEPWLRRLWRRPAGRRVARALFAGAARLRLLNQKMLVRCQRPGPSTPERPAGPGP